MIINTTDLHAPCWLVFSLTTHNIVVLHAIDLDNQIANAHRKALENEESPHRIKVWIEKKGINHLFGEMYLLNSR